MTTAAHEGRESLAEMRARSVALFRELATDLSEAERANVRDQLVRLHLPLAQLSLKQGFGRLIRSRSDYGVVALLDARVHRRGYGRRLLEGLPPARRVTALHEVAEFWARFREARA